MKIGIGAPLVCLLASAAPGWAVAVGTFAAEVRRTYTVADGLPSDDVRCVAAAGGRVWAGTAQGLAVREASGWRVADSRPVSACAAEGDGVLFAVPGAVMRTRGGAPPVRAAALPAAAGEVYALAAAPGGKVLIGAQGGLFDAAGARLLASPVYAAAVSASGEVAAGGAAGIFVNGKPQYPRQGARSWAPVDVRGTVFDTAGRLCFFNPQGLGCRQPDGAWSLYTGEEGLPYSDATALARGEDSVLWLGTRRGAIRYDGRTWEYRQGSRWLPADDVRDIAVQADGTAWFATAKGVGQIERRPMRLADKAKFYESEIDKRHRRTEYEYVHAVHLPRAGDLSEWVQTDSDNDGLWTSMYGAGECFAWAATRDPLAKRRAAQAFAALRFLSEVTQGGEHPAPPGFPARSILPTSGPDPNLRDSRERDLRMQAQRDRLWKIMSPRWPKSADGKWYWKTDTSSDELDGHYFFYALYYDLVAETEQEKQEARAVVRAVTDHLLAHNWSLVDWDGQRTRWAVFDPKSLNEDRLWWAGRGLNSLSILSYLKVAHHMTGDAKYDAAYQRLIRDHHYDTNLMVPKIQAGPGSGNQSDDEMAFMCFYHLLKYETDDNLRQKYALALANYWALERLERNPFFNFIAAASLKGAQFSGMFGVLDLTPRGGWLEDAVDTLKRLPLDRVDWGHQNSHRLDIVPVAAYISEDARRPPSGRLRDGKVLPVDERYFSHWNHNPYQLDTRGEGRSLGDGAVFLLPYYMGLYHGFIKD